MQKIIIDEEFERILPKLDEQTYAWLEENILEYGCREPLILWSDTLIDGHNRYSILKKHGLPINTISMEFDSRDEVLIWIISTQVSRRNLNPLQLSYYRGLHYHADKRVVTNMTGRNQYVENTPKSEDEAQNVPHPKSSSTANRLAEKYGVSHMTIKRDAQIASAINTIGETSPDVKIDILSGKTQISRRQLQELSSGKEEAVAHVVERIREGTLERRRPSTGAGSTHGGNANGSTDSAELRPWEIQFGKMTDELRQMLRNYAKADDTDSVRSALRQYIGMLEDLYQSI